MRLMLVEQDIVKRIGQGRVGFEIAKAALARGIETTLIAITIEEELISLGAKWIPVKTQCWPAFLLTVAEFAHIATGLVKRMAREDEIIHAFGYTIRCRHHVNSSQFVHAAWKKAQSNRPKLIPHFTDLYQRLFTALNARWERRAYFKAQSIVACSQLVKRELLAIGLPSNHIHVIQNAVDTSEFEPRRVPRKQFGLPEVVPLALFAGDIKTPRKNLDAVLKAMVAVPSLHLAVVGAAEGSPYPNIAAQLNLSSRVHFLGFRRDVNKVMQTADFFVFPSHYEPFGNVVMEAMATGQPIISASTVGASDAVKVECGIVIKDPNDHASLAAAMRHLADSPHLRAQMGKAAREIAIHHTWQDMTTEYFRLYQQVEAATLAGKTPSDTTSVRH